jgi:hypothetical protein
LAFRLPHRTFEQHAGHVATPTPRLLLDSPTAKRHEKATDPGTGRLLDYARWNMLPSYAADANGKLTWPKALFPQVSTDEEAEIRRIADAVPWNPNCNSDEVKDMYFTNLRTQC